MLTIEDGTGVPDADSFITEAECEAFEVALFGAALTSTTREAALRRAYVVMMGYSWVGDFPTFGGEVPTKVKMAQAVLAREEMTSAGSLSPVVTPSAKQLTRVGNLAWETSKAAATAANSRPRVAMAMDLLSGLIRENGGTKYVGRA